MNLIKMILELFFKFLLSFILLLVIYISITSLFTIWRYQIDFKQSFYNLLKYQVNKNIGWLIIREDNRIYQNGEAIGRVVGKVENIGDKLVFEKIIDALELNLELPIEYRREKLRIISKEGGLRIYACWNSA